MPVLTDLWLLLALRARSAGNAVRFAKPLYRRIGALLGGASLLLFVGIFAAFRVLLAAVAQTGEPDLLHALIGRTFLFLFLFLFAGAVPFVSGALFAPGDLTLLLATPVRPGAVVAARLLDAAVVSSAQFVVIGLPLLVASAAGVGLPWWSWLVVPLLVSLFLLLPALLTAVLLLTVARLVGLRRVRAAVAVASAILAVGMCLLMVGEFAGQAGRIGAGGVAAISRSAAEGTFRLPAPPAFLPSTWASNALIALASPRPGRAFVPLGALLLATLVSGALAVTVGRRVLLGETLLEGDGVGAGGTGKASALEKGLARVGALSPAARALVAKDARYVARDLVMLSQIGIPVILYLVPFVIAGQAGSGAAAMGRAETWGLSAGLVGVIAYMETSILGLSSVGLEGRGFWMVLHAPVSAATLVRAKFAFACGASLALCLPLYLFSCLVFGMGTLVTLAGTGVLIVACAALSGLAVGIAGIFPRFVYDNPAHRASLAALVWGFVGATIYVVLAGAVLGGGAWLAGQQTLAGKSSAPFVWSVAGALFCLLSLLTALIPLLLARARLGGYAWEE